MGPHSLDVSCLWGGEIGSRSGSGGQGQGGGVKVREVGVKVCRHRNINDGEIITDWGPLDGWGVKVK